MPSFSEQKGLSLDRLQTLCLVAEKGGVMAAAGGNANRQSLYSRQLRELEAFFGSPLIDRTRTPHSLTELGRQAERTVRGFLADLDVLVKSGQSERVPMVIGAGESVIQAILIPVLLAKGAPDGMKLVFRNLQSAAILSGLRSRRLDIGIAHDSGGHADLKSRRLLRYGVRLVTRDAAVGKRGRVSWADLKRLALAVPEGDSELRRALEASMKTSGSQPPAVVECTSHAQVVEAAARKGMAGVVPEFTAKRAAEQGLNSVAVVELEGFARELRLLWHPAAVEMKPQVEGCLRQLVAAAKAL